MSNPEKSAPRPVIDWDRTETVLGALIEAYEQGRYPYNLDSTRLPHHPEHMPKSLPRGGVEHAMFLFTTCYYMRGSIKSVQAFKTLSDVYEYVPFVFDAYRASTMDSTKIISLLEHFGLGMQKTIGPAWVENARRLVEKWDGDPRKIFDGVNTYEEALKRIANDQKGGGFIGFQEKMVSMLTYYLMDEGLIEPFHFPLPVDLHVLRVTIANELIIFPDSAPDDDLYHPATLAEMRRLYYEYALRHKVDILRLCDAVWLLSESLCGIQPGNVTLEPDGRLNRNGRSTKLIPLVVNQKDPNQQRAYERSCAGCPIESTCRWNVPGKPYYIEGTLRRRGERIRFPTSQLFHFGEY